jgi:hypothetical protein
MFDAGYEWSEFVVVVADPHERIRCLWKDRWGTKIPFGRRCYTFLLIFKQQIAQFLLHQATGADCPIRTYTHDDQKASETLTDNIFT